jgi:hypothetical protein
VKAIIGAVVDVEVRSSPPERLRANPALSPPSCFSVFVNALKEKGSKHGGIL